MNVFVIMPYRDAFRNTYQNVIKPVIEGNGLTSVLAEDDTRPGRVDEQIIDSINDSKLCVADLTESNPNVMYEIAYAHSLKKPVVLITKGELKDVPFDIRQYRTIKYEESEEGYRVLKERLNSSIKSIVDSEETSLQILRKILIPSSLGANQKDFVVAANPLSYRAAFRSKGGWKERPLETFSDHVGIRGLVQSFGLIFGFEILPELINPDDFADEVLDIPKNLYSIGSPKANRWTGLMMERLFSSKDPKWDFKPDPESKDILNPKVIIRRNSTLYTPHVVGDPSRLKWDFGLVVRGPHPVDSSFMFMALAGRGALGTEATCLSVTDPQCSRVLMKRLSFEEIDINDHRQMFCAIVSIGSSKLKTDKGSFKVHDVIKY
jgi:hypothetical protein